MTLKWSGCDLCGNTAVMPILAAQPYIGDQTPPGVCTDCGFVYVQERRSAAEIAKSWDDIWGEGYSSKWPAVQARLYYVRQWIEQELGMPKHLFDIGAGEGDFCGMWKCDEVGYISALEPYKGHVTALQCNADYVYTGAIETFDAPPSFDLITINWTLENCGDCVDMLRRARKLCNPDGHVVVATGSRILVPYKKPLSNYFSSNPQDLHSFRFSAATLGMAMAKAGLTPVKYNRYLDSDWLVVAARPSRQGDNVQIEQDDPADVLQYFNAWGLAFP